MLLRHAENMEQIIPEETHELEKIIMFSVIWENMSIEISVIIPTKNEALSISGTIKELKRTLERFDYEILVIDSSKDNTKEIDQSLGAKIYVENFNGYGRAIRKGFNLSNGDIIIVLDGDLSNSLDTLLEAIRFVKEKKFLFITTDRTLMLAKGSMNTTHRIVNKIVYF